MKKKIECGLSPVKNSVADARATLTHTKQLMVIQEQVPLEGHELNYGHQINNFLKNKNKNGQKKDKRKK